MKFLFSRSSQSNSNEEQTAKTGLNTFGGVYTPSILTILGVIMYLRFGWVVGNVGILGTLVIVTLANSITFLTALSICAIATDRVVRVGGAYYMISRSLGIETGGAVGIPLYFAQAISVALYTIGFAESVVKGLPEFLTTLGVSEIIVNQFTDLNQLYVALIVTSLVGILAFTSADIAIRAQYFIMATIAFSLIMFYGGHPIEPTRMEWWVSNKESFWTVFAVFFPAVTGIMAGVNMSGDLKDPSRALPIGTLAAVGTGYLIYMTLPIFLAMRANAATLIADPLIMRRMAIWGPAILMGVWGATLSSAIGSILGAPRVLQALARDNVLPDWMGFLGQGSGSNDEPRIGTAVTLAVALAAVYVGDLNIIAPVLSMFFLTTYLVLNVSAAIEGFLQSPSFRPSFPVHWFFSLLGAISCLVVMFLINVLATVVAGIVVLGVYFWIRQRELRVTWGDVRRGIWMALLRNAILQVDHAHDTKNWRPQILVLSGAPTKRWSLIQLADALTHNRGLVTIASVLPKDSMDIARQGVLERRIRNYLERRGIQGLVRLTTASDTFEGAEKLVETYGLGSIVPNTILLGDSEESHRRDRYCQFIANLHYAKRNVIILRENTAIYPNPLMELEICRRRIDVWWGGSVSSNGSLMLILAYLLRSNQLWSQAIIYLKLVVSDHSAAQSAQANLEKFVAALRIGALCQVIVAENRNFSDILHESSAKADLVFLGMASPSGDFAQYYEQMQQKLANLPTTILVLAAPDFDFEAVLE